MDPVRPLWYPPDQWDHLARDLQYQIAVPSRAPMHDFGRDGPRGDPYPPQNVVQQVVDPNLQHENAKKKKTKKKRKHKKAAGADLDNTETAHQPKKPALARGAGEQVNPHSQNQNQGQTWMQAQMQTPGQTQTQDQSQTQNQSQMQDESARSDGRQDISLHPSESPLRFASSPTSSEHLKGLPTPRHWTPPLPQHAFSHRQQVECPLFGNTHVQAPSEEENTALTRTLVDDVKRLEQHNATLKAECTAMRKRQTNLEMMIQSIRSEATEHQIRSSNQAGGPGKASRTRHNRAKHDRIRRGEESSEESDTDEHNHELALQEQFKYRTLLQPNLPPHLRAARNFLQCQVFRRLCGVSKSTAWPSIDETRTNPETDEEYYTPDFDEDVTHATNSAICKRVAEVVYSELKGLQEPPDELRHADVFYSRRTIEEMAKNTYRGFREQAKGQRNDSKARKRKRNKRNTRRYQHRFHTLTHLPTMVPEYIKVYGQDPTPLLEIDVLSDYASGPDSDDNEPQHMWKARMGTKVGVDVRKVDKEMWAGTTFWEHIAPEWCSDEVTTILDRLQRLFLLSLDKNRRKKYLAYRVYRTGRTTTAPPAFVPWDFAISEDWWNTHGPSWKKEIKRWTLRGDPEGFGSNDPHRVPLAASSSAPTQ
ncbi:hypothetical protein GLOTRDRAFT_126408 [Gloeophyllum trabeum ATCC 11539]|uniref:Uncharacterized protein n=1 Tax=Gloeophyllum trabeum (strain ATCC 11539 / FP-39264 / Madison 617) TaxID=670483 RepID=S7RT99_GLOTA|nr:uncharacterized protein GLOTRDRAFT_126408 [Gloeophyllum trabeum ATCC 11539]EPQ57915.1 hypothetical protein GLOTRDRAFT_126408 [Gloeophyllum trabeum ATCC 11539]